MGFLALRYDDNAVQYTGSVPHADLKMKRRVRLYHEQIIGPVDELTQEQIITAVAQNLFEYMGSIAKMRAIQLYRASTAAAEQAEKDSV